MKKQAIVTGASSGIGYATALQLAQSSIQVLGVARREEELKQLEQEHQNIHTIAVDLLEDQAYKKISQYYSDRVPHDKKHTLLSVYLFST